MITFVALLAAAFSCQQQPDAPAPKAPEHAGTPLPVPRAIAERRGERRIDIDGSLIEWPKIPPIEMVDARQLSGTAQGAWRGPSDLSAFVFMLWDDESLYVGATVQDDWHRALVGKGPSLTEIPACDSLVLTFDPGRDTRSLGPDQGRREDRVFWIGEEASHQLVQWDVLRGTANQLEDGRQVVSHDKEKGLTTYEARIPWRQILPSGATAKSGLVFDLELVINDYDEATDPMPQTRVGWTFGCGPRVDPGVFGSVMLVDAAAALEHMPEFPPRPPNATDPVPGPAHWRAVLAGLAAHPAQIYDGSAAPGEAGGVARLRLLEDIDDQCELFPRVDWLELHHRINRRMVREVAGIEQTGLPWFWKAGLSDLARRAEEQPADATMRIFRLPMGGWLVRTNGKNFAIDPAGNDIARLLWGGMEFVLVTQPLDMTRRNDQLLLRMASDKPPRPYLTHVVMHLPLIPMADESLVEPGKTYGQATGVQVHALGHKVADGSVPYALPYLVELPGGLTLLIPGPSAEVGDLPTTPVTAMVLSARNPHAAEISKHVQCNLIVLDDQFLPQTFPGVPRVRLRDLFALQQAMLPKPSVLLAPGESWDLRAVR